MSLINTTENILVSLKACLEQLDNEQFTKPLSIYSGSTHGQHTRHIIEFYQCLLQQCQSGEVNYDTRIRNLAIENHISVANAAIDEIIAKLKTEQYPETFTLAFSYDGKDASIISKVETNFDRELVYNIEHAVHHMAILKMGIKSDLPAVEFPAEFGVASSTTRYKQTTCAQ